MNCDIQHNDTQRNGACAVILSVANKPFMLNVVTPCISLQPKPHICEQHLEITLRAQSHVFHLGNLLPSSHYIRLGRKQVSGDCFPAVLVDNEKSFMPKDQLIPKIRTAI
jgi:hypothetical protein